MDKNNASETLEKAEIPAPQEKSVSTQHTIWVNEREIKYTATAGTIILKEENEEKGEKPKATIFYIAYSLNDTKNPQSRPITFSFNGGPGSSSVWLHLGLLGPKRVILDDEGNPSRPPYELIENEYTLLDKTDLVFIDPVSTGYSRSVPGEKADQFHTVKKDIESVGDFIYQFTSRNQRWLSPKYIIGESYGTTRAAGLSAYLQDRHGMYLNGIMLISSILNFGTTGFDPGNDLPFILYLPTYTATAWFHNRLKPEFQEDLRKTLDEVEAFAKNEYLLALMKGDSIADVDRNHISLKLSDFTGLSQEYILNTDLRINIFRFCKELLRSEKLAVGRLDSRYTGFDRDNAGEVFERDPSYSAILGPYTATFNHYVRHDLEFDNENPYEILAPIYQKWKFEEWENQYLNVAEDLRKAIATNPYLKIFVANGYYDFATPYFATEYTFDHIGLPKSAHKNITMKHYEAGHMMYVHIPSLKKLKVDLIEFINSAQPS